MIPCSSCAELQTQRLVDFVEDFNDNRDIVPGTREHAVQSDNPSHVAGDIILHIPIDNIVQAGRHPRQVHDELRNHLPHSEYRWTLPQSLLSSEEVYCKCSSGN